MSNTYTFVTAGADADDAQLLALIRSSFLAQNTRDRAGWLTQVELGLVGYGDRHRDITARIKNAVRLLRLHPVTE